MPLSNKLVSIQKTQNIKIKIKKGDKRYLQIIENSIKLFAQDGYDSFSFLKLSKKCKVSRPLIHHYFSNKQDLFYASIDYINSSHQEYIISKMDLHLPHKKADEILENYIEANLKWPLENSSQAKVWIHYTAFISIFSDKQLEYQLSVNHGHQRIIEIIKQGVNQSIWNVSSIEVTAKIIQLLITGTVFSLITEVYPIDTLKVQKNHILKTILAILAQPKNLGT